MALITRMVASKGRSKKVRVYLDGEYAFCVEADVALQSGLHIKQDISQAKIKTLERQNELRRALAASNRLLSFRPRSEKEIRQKLIQKKFDAETVVSAITYLKERGLVDDATFARYWMENRTTFSPRSSRLVNLELRQKGVTAEVAEETSSEIEDEAAAYEAGAKKASHLALSDYEEFRHRLGEYLRRRGFGYDVINSTVKKLWQEYAHKE